MNELDYFDMIFGEERKLTPQNDSVLLISYLPKKTIQMLEAVLQKIYKSRDYYNFQNFLLLLSLQDFSNKTILNRLNKRINKLIEKYKPLLVMEKI